MDNGPDYVFVLQEVDFLEAGMIDYDIVVCLLIDTARLATHLRSISFPALLLFIMKNYHTHTSTSPQQ